jgi:hypothetical protein
MAHTPRASRGGGLASLVPLVLIAALFAGALVLVRSAPPDPARSEPAPAGPAPGPIAPGVDDPRLDAAPFGRGLPRPTVTVRATGTYSWAVLDRRSGAFHASANGGRRDFTESVVKIWLAADHLRRVQRPPLALLSTMIRDSHDGAADTIWARNGGDASIRRMISTCRLRETRVFPGWWSKTLISARDTARLGECVVNGTAAGPRWTQWLLDEMRQVRGKGDFGIIRVIPPSKAGAVGIKNGWWMHGFDVHWRINCLAVHDDWILAIMTRYPERLGFAYGGTVCEQVARQVLGPVL